MGTKKAKAAPKTAGEVLAGKSNRKLTRATLIELYAARRYLGLDALKETGLRMPVEVYFKDPDVAETHEGAGVDVEFTTPWEPGLRDGPTSARFAVVDYDSTSNTLTPPAVWDREGNCYRAPDRTLLDAAAHKTSPVPPAQRLGHRSEHPRFLRKWHRAWPKDQLGVRGQPADRRAACRLRRKRLLRPGQQVASILLVRRRQGTRLHLPLDPTS